jgi:hypothetical protein
MPLKKDLKKLKVVLMDLEKKPTSNWFINLITNSRIKSVKRLILMKELKLEKLKNCSK